VFLLDFVVKDELDCDSEVGLDIDRISALFESLFLPFTEISVIGLDVFFNQLDEFLGVDNGMIEHDAFGFDFK